MKKIYTTALLSMLIIGFGGCTQNKAYKTYPDVLSGFNSNTVVQDTIDEAIIEVADQLVDTSKIQIYNKIAVTSFVNLNKFQETSHFGREISESMFNELHVRGFNLIDIRGTKSIRVNKNGEFFVTRDIKLLNNKIVENSYILVGTYNKFGNGVLLNARILDNVTGEVISTARTIIDIDGCRLDDSCTKKVFPKSDIRLETNNRTIGISAADCEVIDNCKDIKVKDNDYNHGDKAIVRENPVSKININ